MYRIDSKTQINLKHVERTETNDRNNSIIFELVSGKSAVKLFDTPELAASALTSVTALIDGA